MAKKAERRMGLRLTQGGAPASAHVVSGVPGLYRPDVPTPVGGEGELSLEEAKALDADESIPLELVPVEDEAAALEQVAADLEAARGGIAAALRAGPEGSEPGRIQDEAAAIATPTASAETAKEG